jgi:hypothetical protein
MFKPVQKSRFAHLAGVIARRNAEKTRQGSIATSRRKYDAAQERGEAVGPQGGGDSAIPIRNGATAADLGLSRKDIAHPDAADAARRIVDAAELVRTGGRAPKTPTGIAREILDAAALRDAGGHVREKPSGVAAEIIAAGKKRRGLSGSK